MIIRSLSALLLAAFLAAIATSQTPAKDTPKDKDSTKDEEKKIDGKNFHEWWKMTSNPDPAIREQALIVIANFPSDIKKDKTIAKSLLTRLDKQEKDSSVRIAMIDLIGVLELEDPMDSKEAPRILARMVTDGVSALRLHSLEALGRYGPKAHHVIVSLNVEKVMQDPSYQIRVAIAHTLGRIGHTDLGPTSMTLSMLITLSKDHKTEDANFGSAPVRLAALQSLLALGPPLIKLKPAESKSDPKSDTKSEPEYVPNYEDALAVKVVDAMKGRTTPPKGATVSENDKQLELWARLVIIRFGGKYDEQVDAIAQHLSDKEPASVRLLAVELLSVMGEGAAPKMNLIVGMLNEKEPAIKVAALGTLGAIGVKAIDPIMRVILDSKVEPEIRIAALAALARLGERGERARPLLEKIIEEDKNVSQPSSTSIAMLQQALLTLASMGIKAKPAIPQLMDLAKRLDRVKADRLKSPEHLKLLENEEYKRLMARMSKEDKEKLEKNQPEDQFKKFVEQAIDFIDKSTEGHPGGETKKPTIEPKKIGNEPKKP